MLHAPPERFHETLLRTISLNKMKQLTNKLWTFLFGIGVFVFRELGFCVLLYVKLPIENFSNFTPVWVFAENQERFYLYLIVSIAAAVLLCLIILVARLLVQRHRARREAKFHATNIADHSLPNGFTDDISEVDADIDLTTPLPTVAIHSTSVPVGSIAEVVRYPHVHSHTLRRYDLLLPNFILVSV